MDPGPPKSRSLVVETMAGVAEVEYDSRTHTRFLVVLTHGAGGGVHTPDLDSVRSVALELGGSVARVTQPYRVAGGRAPGSAMKQDAAWLEVISALRRRARGVPLVQGGRSNGARVACRTAGAARVAGVIALAFPLHPPGRPELTRVDELRAPECDVVVVNGERDPFGIPDAVDATEVHVVPGAGHSFRKGHQPGELVAPWLLRWSAQA